MPIYIVLMSKIIHQLVIPTSLLVGLAIRVNFRDEMAKAGVDRAVLIQTSPSMGGIIDICGTLQLCRQTGLPESALLPPTTPIAPDMLYALYDRSNVKGMRSIQAAEGVMMAPVFAAYGGKLLNLG
ncbi:MAG: hypothetical protein CM1200mP3_05730 [Chloroflexota bacterium]|nr:MAG: hypothetical protein CM1200mP3_05730 [Chloroflexota bacterium]